MSRVIKLIDDETIEIIRYAKANACFHTNEYPIGETVCVFRETVNPFQLYAELQRKDKIIKDAKEVLLTTNNIEKALTYLEKVE